MSKSKKIGITPVKSPALMGLRRLFAGLKPARRLAVPAFWLVCISLPSVALSQGEGAQANQPAGPAKLAVANAQGGSPNIEPAVREALTPMFNRLISATQLRSTARLTVTSSVGEQVLGKSQGLFQMASKRPNLLSLSAKFDTDAVTFTGDGQHLFVQLTQDDYLQLPAPTVFEEMITAMPIQLGPQPEPLLWLTMAGVNPVEPLLTGLQKLEVVEPSTVLETEEATSTVKATRPEGLVWELTITKGQQSRPVRLLIDMTEMIKQTNNLQVPEGYSFQIRYDFEQWEPDAQISDELYKFTPAENAKKYDSLADYLLRDGAMGKHPLLGKLAPTFTAPLASGEEVTYEHAPDGKVVVLDFWATWCAPCVEALPEMQKLAAKFKDKDVLFYAVNVAETPDAIAEFLKDKKLDLPVIVDPEGQISAAYAATAIPQTVLIGKGGRIEAVHVGFDENESMSILEKEIETLLAGRRIYEAEEQVLESPDDAKNEKVDRDSPSKQ